MAVPKGKYKLSETKPHLIGIKQILGSTVHTLLPLSANLFCISSGFGNLAESQVMYLVERTRLQILNPVRLSTTLHTWWNFECSSMQDIFWYSPFSIRVFNVQPQNIVWNIVFVKVCINTEMIIQWMLYISISDHLMLSFNKRSEISIGARQLNYISFPYSERN